MKAFFTKKVLIIILSTIAVLALGFGIIILINFNGYLVINTESDQLTLTIDDETTAYLPGEKITLRAGKHQIIIKEDGAKEETQEIDIKFNKETVVTPKLEPEVNDSTLPELKINSLEYN